MSRLRFLAAAVALLLLVAVPATAFGQASGAAAPTLKLSTQPKVDDKGQRLDGQVWIDGKVASADGKTLANRTVTFFEQVDFFGTREAVIGSAATDPTGVASVLYTTSQAGRHVITARLTPLPGEPPVSGNIALNVSQAAPPYTAQPLPFASVREWLPLAFGLIVVATWAVLLVTFASAVRGVRRAGRLAAGAATQPAGAPSANPGA